MSTPGSDGKPAISSRIMGLKFMQKHKAKEEAASKARVEAPKRLAAQWKAEAPAAAAAAAASAPPADIAGKGRLTQGTTRPAKQLRRSPSGPQKAARNQSFTTLFYLLVVE